MFHFLSFLGDLLSNAFSSRFKRELVSRPQPDDQAFHDAFYGFSGIPQDIPIRRGWEDESLLHVAQQRFHRAWD
jgi:hypothetical protein